MVISVKLGTAQVNDEIVDNKTALVILEIFEYLAKCFFGGGL